MVLIAHTASGQAASQATEPAAAASSNAAAGSAQETQTASPAPADTPASPTATDIVVTGTRLRANGYDAPTPTQVLGPVDLQRTSPKNIDDFVNQIPSVSGSMTLRSRNTQASNGTNGITSPSLRSLGTQRTLVLLDGQRMVPVTQTGETDAGTIPQQLIQRIDVVTGGASALYGSDALAGVVNFVLDTKFTGLKLEAQGGVTTYGDDANYRLAGTWGAKFAGDRGHFLISSEYQWNKGIGRYRDRVAAGEPPRRSWMYGAPILVNNPAYNATTNRNVPQFISSFNGSSFAASAGATPGGIISGVFPTATSALTLASPLVGTAFTNAGAPYAFGYGQTDVNTPRQFMIGGDWQRSDVMALAGLDPYYRKINTLARADFDVTDHVNVFFQYQHAYSTTWGSQSTRAWIGPVNAAGLLTGTLRLASDNAYLRAALANDPARLALLNSVNSVAFGTFSEAEPLGGRVSRKLDRLVTGGSGQLFVGEKSFDWHLNYQHGISRNHEEVTGSHNIDHLTNAIDAVLSPTGQIVCRSTLTNPGNGCVPLNLVGYRGALAPEAEAYSFGDPYRDNRFIQDVVSADIAGEPFDLWAGAVSVAAGVERRWEKLRGSVDPISRAGTTPQANGIPNPLLGWSTNYIAINGSYNVTEGFLEAAVPLLRDAPLAQLLKVDGAVRATDYSTSGYVTTWKAGLIWEPVAGIRFRGSQSRDIRAPSFVELFAAGSPISLQLVDRSVTPNVSYPSVIQATVGNLGLTPEKADTTGGGVVLEPRLLPGFSFSVDYYKIKVKDAIGTVTAQTIVDQCALGNAVFCPAIVRVNGSITQVNNQYFNFASQDFRGIDFEASYTRQLGDGRISLRAFATRYLKAKSEDGISPPVNYLGDLGLNVLTPSIASLPKLKYRLSATYDRDAGSLTLIGRGASGGNWGYNQLECSTACPTTLPTGIIRTVDNNHAPASFYLDANITLRPGIASSAYELFASVQNVFNRDPGIQPRSPAGQSFGALPTNPTVYDTLGRVFQAGIRAKF